VCCALEGGRIFAWPTVETGPSPVILVVLALVLVQRSWTLPPTVIVEGMTDIWQVGGGICADAKNGIANATARIETPKSRIN